MRFSILTLLIVTTICAVGTMSWNSSRPPSVAEWGFTVPPDGNHNMDEGCAYEHFYGKSWQEALGLLEENDEYYVEDFSYMPKPAFNFITQFWLSMSQAIRWANETLSAI